ncbi:MAG: M28 family peptidase [Bacteroidia bacterium]|nr:MAG: M28 family peptidase [Bacteroidia bacterium]
MILRISALLLLSVLLSVNTKAQTDPVMKKIVEIGNSDNRSMEHLDILCNRFGGRLIGSDAYENAALWASSKFEEWGMEVVMDEVGELPVGFNRGPWFGKLLAENGMDLHFATPSYTSGTIGVQRGHVLIEPKTEAEFQGMKGALKGAWVLIGGINNGWPIDISVNADHLRDSIKVLNAEIEKTNTKIRQENRNNRGSGEPEKKLMPMVDEPALFYREMVEAGILGIIQSSRTPIRVLYDRKNLSDMTFENLPTTPDIKLDEHQYKLIYQMAEERRYFQLEFDIRNHFKMGPVKYHNVIGVIPGSEFPEEYVIVGGHLDAFDVATGGVDDGSGVTPSMEAARLIMEAGGKPKRTILVTLWAGEEFGLYGSTSWVTRFEADLDKVSNMVNRDGGPEVPVSLTVSAAQMEDFKEIAEVINTINPDFPLELKERTPRPRPERAWGTDSGPFAVKGVPTIGFDLGDPKGYNFSYGEIWHTERDTYNKSIPEYQEHTATATAILVYGLANLDHKLSREGFYIEKVEESDRPVKKEKKRK